MKNRLVIRSSSLHDALMQILTEDEKNSLKAMHRLERDGRVRDRIKAVLLRDKGWSILQIAEALLLSEDTVRSHINDFLKSQKLKPENGGSTSHLTEKQSSLLLKHLEEHTYLYVKSIVRYIKLTFGVDYTVSGMTDWLKRQGFVYKKPKLVPGKADLKQQEKWIKEYEVLRASLLDSEAICFIDGVHPCHNVQLHYGWIKRGAEKLIASNSGRSRINLTGAIDMVSHEIVIQEDKTINAESTIRFFQKLESHYTGKSRIHVFCDNAGYYRSKQVKAHLKTSNISLHFLPPYSPNLNPIERLWKWMKESVVYNTYYEMFEEFRDAIFGFFKTLSGLDPGSELGCSLRSRIRDKFRAIAAPAPASR